MIVIIRIVSYHRVLMFQTDIQFCKLTLFPITNLCILLYILYSVLAPSAPPWWVRSGASRVFQPVGRLSVIYILYIIINNNTKLMITSLGNKLFHYTLTSHFHQPLYSHCSLSLIVFEFLIRSILFYLFLK